MIDETRQRLREFTRPDLRIRKGILAVGFVISILGVIGCLTQTELWVSLWCTPPPEKMLHDEMRLSQELQAKIRMETESTLQEETLVFDGFKEHQKTALRDAYQYFLNKDELQVKLQKRFGTSMRDVKIRVVAAWELDGGWMKEKGITEDAYWKEFKPERDGRADAMTIRERPIDYYQRTTTGTTVVIIKENAFASIRAVRFAFFHELLHCLNLPGYRHKIDLPYFGKKLPIVGEVEYTQGQTDLAYLEEYRWFTAKEGLCSLDTYAFGFFAWVFLIFTFTLTVVQLFLRDQWGAD